MNRRNFFRLLTGVAATPVLAPLAKLLPAPTPETVRCVIGEYADYLTVSDIVIEKAIDPTVEALGTYYSKSFMATLRANTTFDSMEVFKPLPENTGKTIKFYSYGIDNSTEV
jgi:hypothetical protein